MNEIFRPDQAEAIVYDPVLFNEPAAIAFDSEHWPSADRVGDSGGGGGRGATYFVADNNHRYVLRRYYRGGLPRYLLRDRYFWWSEEATRSFREWRLLDQLRLWELPAPRAAAARFQRRIFLYTADILTVRLEGVHALSDLLVTETPGESLWRAVGATIARFHRRGVCHADLNAHNIQVGDDESVYLLDFDKGKILSEGSWRLRNLERLHRSLNKISATNPTMEFSPRQWQCLRVAYDSEYSSA